MFHMSSSSLVFMSLAPCSLDCSVSILCNCFLTVSPGHPKHYIAVAELRGGPRDSWHQCRSASRYPCLPLYKDMRCAVWVSEITGAAGLAAILKLSHENSDR